MNNPHNVHIKSAPSQAHINNMQSMRGTVLGQVHYGNLDLAPPREGMRFLIKSAAIANGLALLGIFITFRFMDMFPPHDQPFMSAVGWFFVFGALYAGIAFLVFRTGHALERHAVAQAVAANRRYEWHSRYDTSKLSEADLKKIAEAPKTAKPQTAPVGVADNFYKFVPWLAMAGYLSCAMGIYAFMTTLG